MSNRETGFYWVKFRDDWVVAEWDSDSSWNLCGSDNIFDDSDLAEIDENKCWRNDPRNALCDAP